MRRRTGAICIAISTLFLVLIIIFQFTLPSHDLYVSSNARNYHDTNTLIPESSVMSSDSVSEPKVTEEPKTTKPAEPFLSTEFQPVGLPFDRNDWYKLFRYYQQKQYNTSYFLFQRSLKEAKKSARSWSLFKSRSVDMLYIREGCVDLKHQLLLIMNPDSSTKLAKRHLRNPETLESSVFSEVKIPGFESYPLYQVDASIPNFIRVHPANFSWILSTPPSSQDSCIESIMQYAPLFIQSISPLFRNDVGDDL